MVRKNLYIASTTVLLFMMYYICTAHIDNRCYRLPCIQYLLTYIINFDRYERRRFHLFQFKMHMHSDIIVRAWGRKTDAEIESLQNIDKIELVVNLDASRRWPNFFFLDLHCINCVFCFFDYQNTMTAHEYTESADKTSDEQKSRLLRGHSKCEI